MTIEQYITKLSEMMGEQIDYAEEYDTHFEEEIYRVFKQGGDPIGISKVKLDNAVAHSFDILEHMKLMIKYL
jgi:hypothetical protein